MIYFLAVNYGTSYLIEEWVANIRNVYSNNTIVLVDNFKSEEERKKTIDICNKVNIDLILSDNIGYGRGLNKAIEYCFEKEKNKNFYIFAGNLDIEYVHIPDKLPKGKYVYVPIVEESIKKNRNPFLTKIQKNIFPIYYLAGYFKSIPLLYFAIAVNKVFSKIPSQIWAVHGSLFCFNSSCVENDKLLFNEKSFLYCEELEFASYMEHARVDFLNKKIKIIHKENAATGEINTSKKSFFKLWWPSYKNWYTRWK